MFKKLLAKKTVTSLTKDAQVKRHTFARSLTALNLVTIGIGAIIGAGLFVITGQVAAEHTGPSIVFSFLIAGGISLFAALCYAEFAAMIPISGSAYSYAYATLGEFPAWILGWGLTVQYMLVACTVAVGWSSYFSSLLQDFSLCLPSIVATAPLLHSVELGWHLSGSWINLPAVLIVALMGGLISIGTKAAAGVNNVLVVVKLVVVALFIGCGFFFIKGENLTPFIPKNTGVFGQMGFSGILQGASVLFFAFTGFDALSTLTQETNDPQKDMPKGMIGSITICTSIYLVFSLVLVGLVKYDLLGVPDPIAVAIDILGDKFIWLRLFIKVAILAGLTTVTVVMLLGLARIFYTMAHDGLLPKRICRINDKTHVPFFTTIVVTILGMLIAGLFPVGILGQLVSIATLMAFSIVCIGILILHYTKPSLHRPFSVPFKPWLPLIGAIACLAQMFMLPWVTWKQFGTWLLIGCIIYFAYGIRKSHVQQRKSTYFFQEEEVR